MRGGICTLDIIDERDIWNIIKSTLNFVDERLISHGAHVAYLTYKMMEYKGGYTQKEMSDGMLISLLHDVGAYKTDEIDKMIEFESDNMWEHSVYGYLFLKRLSPIKNYADVILYHHMNYDTYEELPYEVACKDTALLMKLTDRIDVLLGHNNKFNIKDYLEVNKGTLFDPAQVDWFMAADEAYHLIDKLTSGRFEDELNEYIGHIHLNEDEKLLYLQMLAFSIDFRSEYMVLHTVTTNSISCTLARHLNFGDKDLWKIYFGSLLHDLGKVAIPIDILEKPGKLTDDEMTIMKRHVVITGDILKEYVDNDVYRMAVLHHEKMDGSGYPFGLKGEQLSLGERIVAIADIVSALIRKRSYKDAFDTPVIREILVEMRDDHKICPDVTNLILENYDEIITESDADSQEVLGLYTSIKQEYVTLIARAYGRKLGGESNVEVDKSDSQALA